jgi:hypothetical protein
MTLLTPVAGLAALAALLTLAAAFVARARTDAARRVLQLPSPHRRTALLQPALAAAAVALLGLAAAQPALTRTSSPRVRRNVQALFVLDVSRSMAASASPSSPTRLDRAAAAAVRLRSAIPQVESGVLTLTDRVLPDLLPVPDRTAFAAVVRRTVRIESPPPRGSSVRATTYGALADIATGNAFASTAARRIVVLLTDGESTAVQTADVAAALSASKGYRFAAIRFWHGNESVYDGTKPEAAYRPDPSGRAPLEGLASALGGRSFEESQLGAAAAYVRGLAGSGPTVRAAATERRRVTLSPYLALLGTATLLAALALSTSVSIGLRLTRQ